MYFIKLWFRSIFRVVEGVYTLSSVKAKTVEMGRELAIQETVAQGSAVQQYQWLEDLLWKKVSAPKKELRGFPLVFRNPLRPAAREPMSVAILLNVLSKRRELMNVSASNVRDGKLKRRLILAVIVKGRHA
jgi:hypothetical protein